MKHHSLHALPIGDQPPRFVFLHGLFGRGRNWTMIARGLLPQSSLLVDLPDHGDSDWSERFSYTDMADHVAQLLADLPKPICLVGHSLGGRVAMMTALRHPGLLERLVVEDTAPIELDMTSFVTYADAMAQIDLNSLTQRHQAREQLRATIPDERIIGFLLQNLRPTDQGGWSWAMNLAMLRRDMAAVGHWPPVTGHFDLPVLWIIGGHSQRVSPAHNQAMKTLFPLTRRVVIKQAGHWVHADDPAAFLTALRQFAVQGEDRDSAVRRQSAGSGSPDQPVTE